MQGKSNHPISTNATPTFPTKEKMEVITMYLVESTELARQHSKELTPSTAVLSG